MALLTRSRLSRMLVSGSPTIVNSGIPFETSTWTMTGSASTPMSAALRRLDNMPAAVQIVVLRKIHAIPRRDLSEVTLRPQQGHRRIAESARSGRSVRLQAAYHGD